ncbi:hypothetical protein [uncultured Clostridium sp.]|uniref:hypothetical protein n=1 Tax=uncultured Clostridium sp. TaxID=59620 RepID=UPI002596A22B|nr:hypothetical protein [uncultured Clostridium sp.]
MFILVSCGESVSKEVTPEEKFTKVFEKELNNRWTEVEKLDSEELDADKYNEELIKIVTKELDEIKKAAEGLTDITLKEIAENYIKGAEAQIESFKTSDYELQWKYQEEANRLRKPAIVALVEKYGVVIDEEHTQTYKDFKEYANIVELENEAKKYAEKLALEMTFTKVEDEYGSQQFETIIENSSEIDYESLSFSIKCKDSNGITVSTDYIYLNDFSPGEKSKEVIYAFEEGIETLEVNVDSFYLKQ